MVMPPVENVISGVLETYALIEVIGRGAYGVVYKGVGRREGRYVAVKRVARAELTTDEKQQLQEEVSLLRNLNHLHIVKYVEAVDDPASPYLDIVMEYVEGGSLFTMVRDIRKSLVDRNRVLGEEPAAMFIRQVVTGLRYLHYQGVIHSDIKGANILVTKDRCVKLADFGLASTRLGNRVNTADAETSPRDFMGSPYWMAPELVRQEGKSTASDIWSVGCTVMELLTGFPPNHKLSGITALFRLMNDDCPPLPSNVSPECEDFLRMCFTKDMRTRATADDLLQHRWLNKGAPLVTVGPNLEESTDGPVSSWGEQPPAAGDDVIVNGGQGLEMYEENDDDDDFGDIEFDDNTNGAVSVDGDDSYLRRGGAPISDTSFGDDPFSGIKEDPEAELERERKRKQKELWDRIKGLAQALGTTEDAHVAACEALVDIFRTHPEQRYNLIYDPGLYPILDVLENCGDGNPLIVESMLRVSLSLLDSHEEAADPIFGQGPPLSSARRATIKRSPAALLDTDAVGYFQTANIPHDLCLAGFLPAVMQYCEKTCRFETRCLAARFLEHIMHGESTTHMFIACRGFTVFVRMLEDDVLQAGVLNRVALGGIERMLSMDNQRHKRDFCRRFVAAGLLQRLARNISHTMRLVAAHPAGDAARTDVLFPHIVQLASLLQTFAARADPGVKMQMTAPEVLAPLMSLVADTDIPREAVSSVLCCVRDISRDPQTHAALHTAGAVTRLVAQLSSDADDRGTRGGGKPQHYIVSTLHNLCILSAARQEEAAHAGVVPHLIRYIRSNDMNLRALCVDIYSGLACASHRTRLVLAKCNGVDFYVELLQRLSVPGTVRKWQARVLQAMCEWLEDQSETQYVEDCLVRPENCDVLCKALAGVGVEDVEGVLEPYWRLVSASNRLNDACGRNNELVSAMVSWLDLMHDRRGRSRSFGGPRGRLLLLRTLLAHARLWKKDSVHSGLVRSLHVLIQDILQTDEAIMVCEHASQLLQALDDS